MDAREYADVTGVDPYTLPLIDLPRERSGATGRSSATLVDARRRTRMVGRTGRSPTGSPTSACPVLSWGGWYDNYIGPQLADHAV